MSLGHAIMSMIDSNVEKVRAINRRYAHPRVIMSPVTRWALFLLRVYVLFIVGLLVYKFITLVRG